MAIVQHPTSNAGKVFTGYRGGLARSLVRTLLLFTFIPLILMAGVAFLRSRALLRDQVITQTRGLITIQIQQMDEAVKTKNIRLDRVIRDPFVASLIATALITNPPVDDFNNTRSKLNQEVLALNPSEGKASFNEFILLKPDGSILLASKPEWENFSLKETPVYKDLSTGNDQSYLIYNLAPFYLDQMVLATVVPYIDPGGRRSAILVGFSETQDLQDVLHSMSTYFPSAGAYFIIPAEQSKTFVGIDPYTNQLNIFTPSAVQNTKLSSVLDGLMGTGDSTPHTLEFNISDSHPVLAQAAWSDTLHTGIVMDIQQDTIFLELNSLVPFTIALFLISLLAMGVVISIGTSRVFRPLSKLTDITKRFSEGDFDQRADVQNKDEIGLLADSFNRMAGELNILYRTLEQKVEERTLQIRTAAEVAQRITSTSNIEEILNRTVELIVEQFNFYQASIFMLDREGKVAVLRGSFGPAAEEMLSHGYRLEVGSASIIGWVCSNNKPRLASDVSEDPMHLINDLLPETRSEVGIPIEVGGFVLGALDVQSTQPSAFGPETVVMLQTLASQIAVAIQNAGLLESNQINFHELERLHRASRQIAAAHSKEEALQTTALVLADTPYPAVVLSVNNNRLELAKAPDVSETEILRIRKAVKNLESAWDEVQNLLSLGPVIELARANNSVGDRSALTLASPLAQYPWQLGYQSVAYLPIRSSGKLVGLITIGGLKQNFTEAMIQPYTNIADLVGTTLDRISEAEEKERQLSQREALALINRVVTESVSDLDKFFLELHKLVRQNIGDFDFSVEIYDDDTQSISVPYLYREGRLDKVEPFPMGDSLSSILLRSGESLLIDEDINRRIRELGAKTSGKPPKSWMGVPMIIQNKPIGALILQDVNNEHAFDSGDINFFEALANQSASVIQNARLIEVSKSRALQLETAAEVARDISGSLDLDELLVKAVNFIRERFNFYHASIFLVDEQGESAVVREASGDAGVQLKRAGFKLEVGSKSIVGYVAGRGERLIVNDTLKDATYLANPLLPKTRSEAAIPLKISERIIGVLDVQSEFPFIFKEDNLRTLQILADQLSVAVINSELFAETQEHLSQHRLLQHLTTSAASGTTLEEALESAVSGLQVTLGGDRVAILLVDREMKHLAVKAAVGYSESILDLRIPIGAGLTGWAVAHHRSLRVDNVKEDPRYIEGSANTISEMVVPLIYRNEVLGVLNVESEKYNTYTASDEEMLSTLGGSLAAIIANARLLEQLRTQAERERTLYEITNKIRHSTDMKSILAITASELTKAVGARHTQIKISAGQPTEDLEHIEPET